MWEEAIQEEQQIADERLHAALGRPWAHGGTTGQKETWRVEKLRRILALGGATGGRTTTLTVVRRGHGPHESDAWYPGPQGRAHIHGAQASGRERHLFSEESARAGGGSLGRLGGRHSDNAQADDGPVEGEIALPEGGSHASADS